MSRISASWIVMAPAMFMATGRISAPPERVQLTMATLHAAALTTPQGAGDSTDTPFIVVEVIGPRASAASILAQGTKPSIRVDEQIGARPLTELSLADGDSVQVLVSVLENAKVQVPTEKRMEAASIAARATSTPEQVTRVTRLVAPLMKDGAQWLGSVSLLLTNEGGAIYWRRFDCVASCRVLNAPAATPLAAPTSNSVVELSGNGGTYHLALQANRAQ